MARNRLFVMPRMETWTGLLCARIQKVNTPVKVADLTKASRGR